jgi:hypothetical protein
VAISLRGAGSTVNSSSSTSLVMTKPSGVLAGDLIIIWCLVESTTTTFSDTTDGFTALTHWTGSSVFSYQLLYKFATGSEGSTFTVTASVSHLNAATIAVLGGVSGFDPAPAAGTVTTSGTALTAPSITTVYAGDTLLWFGATGQASATGAPTLSIPSGYNSLVTQANSGPGSGTDYVSMISAYVQNAAAGATGTVSGSTSAAELGMLGQLISLQAAPPVRLIIASQALPIPRLPLLQPWIITQSGVAVIVSGTATLSGSGTITAAGYFAGQVGLSGSGTITAAGYFTGQAGLTGSGSLTSGVTLGYSAGLSGSGSIIAAGYFSGAASLSGSGSISNQVTIGPSAALSGSGSITAAGYFTGSVSLSGSGSISEQVTLGYSTALSGSGSLTASGYFAGSSSLSGSGSISEQVTLGYSAALSGSGSISASAHFVGSASLSSSGSISEQVTLGYSAALSGSGSITATGSTSSYAALSGSGSISESVTLGYSAALSGSGAITGSAYFSGASSLSGSGSITENTTLGFSAVLSSSGSITASDYFAGAVSLTGSGTISETVTRGFSATLSGSGSISAYDYFAGAAPLSGIGSLASTVALGYSAALSGSGVITESLTLGPSALLSGTGSFTSAAILGYSAALSGSGSIRAMWSGLQTLISGTGTLSATGTIVPPPPLMGGNFVSVLQPVGWVAGLARGNFAVVLQPVIWEVELTPPGGWTIVIAQSEIYATSLANVPVNITPPLLVNPTLYEVQFAFLATDPPEPQPTGGQWVSGAWNNDYTAPPYQAQCLVGPGGAKQLTEGTWNVWVQINSTGTGEIPVLYAGVLYVL